MVVKVEFQDARKGEEIPEVGVYNSYDGKECRVAVMVLIPRNRCNLRQACGLGWSRSSRGCIYNLWSEDETLVFRHVYVFREIQQSRVVDVFSPNYVSVKAPIK